MPKALTPPPRPREVVAELLVARPGELWARVRPQLGQASLLLPKNLELAVGAVCGLSPLVASRIDSKAPLVGALGIDAAGAGLVLGFKVQSGAEMVAALTTGNAPSHRTESEGELALLLPASGGQTGPALAILDDTLLLGQREKLAKLGGFVVRSLGRGQPPARTLLLTAHGQSLSASVVPLLRQAWLQRRERLEQSRLGTEQARGRVADFADPAAVLKGVDASLDFLFTVLASAEQVELELSVEDARALLDFKLVPRPEGAARALALGLSDVPLSALSRLPEQTLFGLLLGRSAPASRSSWAGGLKQLFGERLSDADFVAAEAALKLLDEGRGQEQLFAASLDGAVIWTGEVADPEKLEGGIRGTLALIRRKPFLLPFAEIFGSPRLHYDKRPPGQDRTGVHSATMTFTPTPAQRTAGQQGKTLEILWVVDAQRFTLVLAPDADPWFDRMASGGSGRPELSASQLLAPTSRAALAGALELGVLSAATLPGASRAPVAFAVTGDAEALRMRIGMSPGAVELLARSMVLP